MEKQKTDEEVLQDFLLDRECLDELNQWTRKFNIFDVLKISRTEIRHSNILAWLLDASENHGLGDAFVKGIIQRIVENDMENRYDVFELLLLDYNSVVVLREWKNIDLLLVSEKEQILVAIENKVGSHEHDNQLNRYRKILEDEYSEFCRIYIYLTPDGEEPSDIKNWSVLTYVDVVEILESIKDRESLLPEVELLINNYIDTIRREIVEDEKLIEICNKIYQKHKRALDLIYENKTDGGNADTIKNLLQEEANKGNLYFQKTANRHWIGFYTELMNNYFPILEESNSSWKTQYVYTYWLYLDEERFRIILEVGGRNVPELQMQNMSKMISILKPKDDKKIDFKYKRLFGTKWFPCGDGEEELKQKIDTALSEVKKFEKELSKKMETFSE